MALFASESTRVGTPRGSPARELLQLGPFEHLGLKHTHHRSPRGRRGRMRCGGVIWYSTGRAPDSPILFDLMIPNAKYYSIPYTWDGFGKGDCGRAHGISSVGPLFFCQRRGDSYVKEVNVL